MENCNIINKTAIIIFAKTLDVPVKTRIALTEGTKVAETIYRELLVATDASLENFPYHVAYTGSREPGELTTYFPDATSYFSQTGDGLGERMKNACFHCQKLGFSSSIIIGCDCPDRTTDDIRSAITCLERGTDVVLGPVEDGGYHLAGVNLLGTCIFDATLWSTPQLMKETMEIIRKHDLKVFLLPMRMDIDTVDQYDRWKKGLH